jgi:hypothetical protein
MPVVEAGCSHADRKTDHSFCMDQIIVKDTGDFQLLDMKGFSILARKLIGIWRESRTDRPGSTWMRSGPSDDLHYQGATRQRSNP